MTDEFEMLLNDPDLESTRGPGGTLIFIDGGQYCIIGPRFVSFEDGKWYAFGETKEQAITNYAIKHDA